jgi:hypothetical protein
MDLKAVLQGIKPDLVAVKERWSDEIKVCTHPNPQPLRRDPLTLRMGQHVRNASSPMDQLAIVDMHGWLHMLE